MRHQSKKIIGAYSLWGQDHSGFWPPRCGPADGCTEANDVWILVDTVNGPREKQAGTAYYTDPGLRDEGLAIVGLPAESLAQPGEPHNLEDYPLNTYVIPGWQFGEPFEETRCPSDAGTIMTTAQMNADNLERRGLMVGQVASLYEAFGTSYLTNIEGILPWLGHGDWARSVAIHPNKMESPNFNPDLIYRPGAYVAGLDLGVVHPHWNKFVGLLTGERLGDRVVGAKWHEDTVPEDAEPTWFNSNAYHVDGHVTFSRRTRLQNAGAIIPVPNAQCFIAHDWSMFPLKLDLVLLEPPIIQICQPSP